MHSLAVFEKRWWLVVVDFSTGQRINLGQYKQMNDIKKILANLDMQFAKLKAENEFLSKKNLTDEEMILKIKIVTERVDLLRNEIFGYETKIANLNLQSPEEEINQFDLCIYKGKAEKARQELVSLMENHSDINLGDARTPREVFVDTLSILAARSMINGDFLKAKKLGNIKVWAEKFGIYLVDNS